MFAFYVPFIIFWRKYLKLRLAKMKFYRGVISVIENSADNFDSIPQIQMLYRRLSEKYNSLSEEFRSASEMIEDIICSVDTVSPKRFKEIFKMDIPIKKRSRFVDILKIMKSQQPFSTLSSKVSNLLNMLNQAIDTENYDLAKNILIQIADEFEILEGNRRTQFKKTRLSFVISVMGVILTIFFGSIAFIQFLIK